MENWNSRGENSVPYPAGTPLKSVLLYPRILLRKDDPEASTRMRVRLKYRERLGAGPIRRHEVKRVPGDSTITTKDGVTTEVVDYECSLMHSGHEGNWRERHVFERVTPADGGDPVRILRDVEMLSEPTRLVFREHEYQDCGVWPPPVLPEPEDGNPEWFDRAFECIGVKAFYRPLLDPEAREELGLFALEGAQEAADAALAKFNARE